ncbi:MAG: FecR domain-containing protein [Prevotella sp.]|jgi:ferric-dicitrate binding protein FerR (iron transport regulator)|nr:FecR domain-containing protein [Prevotella sp.]
MPTRIHEIIRQYFNNNYPDRLQKEFISWIKDTDDKAEKDAAFRSIWDELDIIAGQSAEKSYEILQAKIQATSIPDSKKRLSIRKLLRIAAILVLPLISAGITYWAVKNSNMADNSLAFIECIVPDGEIRTITLPDSSVVKVNSGSILIYPRHFTGTRDIFLNGEAYFTVAKDETKPFIVKTSSMDVEALGTIFNVSAYTDSENLSASLESGKVNVTFKNTDKESVLLLPNEQVTYGKKTGLIKKKTVKIENVIAWINGNMVIQSMPVNEVIKIIERKYAVKVYFDPDKYRDERITMRIMPEEGVADFMTVLKYLIPSLKYKIENDNIFIY